MQVKVLKKAGLPAKEEDAMHMVRMLDKDKDGAISFQEFMSFCCLLPAAQAGLSLSFSKVLYRGQCCCCGTCIVGPQPASNQGIL